MYKFIFIDYNGNEVYESVSNFNKADDAQFAGECYCNPERYPEVISIRTKLVDTCISN